MGEASCGLGLYQRAKALQEQALELQRRLHGPHSTEVATALMSLSLTLERRESIGMRSMPLGNTLAIFQELADSGESIADALTTLGRGPEAAGKIPRC